MAVPTNTYTTFTTEGIREDLIDVITNIDPIENFVTSHTGNKRSMQTLHEWQTDVLDTAGANAQVEGDDATATAITPTVKENNYTQILSKSWRITNTNDAVNSAGRGSEVDYQQMLKTKAIAKDIEYALVINTTESAGNSATARTMKGMDGWITTNCTNGGGVGSAGASAALSEGRLNDCLQDVWADGGDPQYVLCGTFQKRIIDGFSTNTRNIQADEKKLVSSVDVYYSSFGDVKIMKHRQINDTIASRIIVLGDMNLWNKAWLRPVVPKELALTGDSRNFLMTAELTLESLQEKGSGKISNLTIA